MIIWPATRTAQKCPIEGGSSVRWTLEIIWALHVQQQVEIGQKKASIWPLWDVANEKWFHEVRDCAPRWTVVLVIWRSFFKICGTHKERTSWSLPWNQNWRWPSRFFLLLLLINLSCGQKMNGEGPRRAAAGFQCVSCLPALPPGERVGTWTLFFSRGSTLMIKTKWVF